MRTRFWELPAAEPQLGRGEEPVDDHVIATDAVVHEFGGIALRADDEQRRHLALADAARELDEDLPAVVIGAQGPPRRAVAFDRIAEIDVGEINAGGDGHRSLGLCVLAAQRDELVLRILPGHGRPCRLLGRAQLNMVGAPVGVDDEIGHQVRADRLDEDMDLAASRRSRFRCRR